MKVEHIDKIMEDDPEYGKTLFVALLIVGDEESFLTMLERAEKQGKRILIKETDSFEEPTQVYIG